MNSDEIMESLKPYGRTCVFQSGHDGTFSAQCTLFIHGITAEVRSGFRHPTMLVALTALREKVFALLPEGNASVQPALMVLP